MSCKLYLNTSQNFKKKGRVWHMPDSHLLLIYDIEFLKIYKYNTIITHAMQIIFKYFSKC